MNTLPNDHGYGAAEIARGEMACNDAYAPQEMRAAAFDSRPRPTADIDSNTINATAQVHL